MKFHYATSLLLSHTYIICGVRVISVCYTNDPNITHYIHQYIPIQSLQEYIIISGLFRQEHLRSRSKLGGGGGEGTEYTLSRHKKKNRKNYNFFYNQTKAGEDHFKMYNFIVTISVFKGTSTSYRLQGHQGPLTPLHIIIILFFFI